MHQPVCQLYVSYGHPIHGKATLLRHCSPFMIIRRKRLGKNWSKSQTTVRIFKTPSACRHRYGMNPNTTAFSF